MSKRLIPAMPRHPLLTTLISLRGNPRACVYTEPLWGIPYSLYVPFFTLYMYALGVNDQQIGFLISLGMIFQVFAALLGGILTDKLGRRLTTVIFDVLSWSVPTLIWAFSQNFWWFLVAAIFNSLWQITNNSWNCLLVEDCEPNQLVHIYTWVTISGLLAVFFAPISGILVRTLTVVPAVRILFGLTFIMMTTKFIILFRYSRETERGEIRRRETKGVSIWAMLRQYKSVLALMLHTRETLQVLGIMLVLNITSMISGSFFSLYVTQNLQVPDAWLAYFPMVRAAVMLIFIFSVQTMLNRLPFHIPVMTGLVLYLASQVLLIAAPAGQPIWLILYVLCEALAFALVVPQKDTLLVLFVNPEERARIISLLYVAMIGLSAPFGTVAGLLSARSRQLPFVLNMVFYLLSMILVIRMRQESRNRSSQASQ